MKKILITAFLIGLTAHGWAASPKTEKLDKNNDGKTDTWLDRDEKGALKYSAKDTNGDGKPDVFTQYIKGRNLILREFDKNDDGKIDERALVQWDSNRRTPLYDGGRMTCIPTPGYTALWVEEDKDFDGKIDVYREKGNKNPPKDKIGQPIEKGR